MTQEIKAGDYVYIPTCSRKALLVKEKQFNQTERNLIVNINDYGVIINFNKNGLTQFGIEPSVWLATPENKTRIEQFYGIELEAVPVDDDVELFKEMLDISLSETEKGNFNKEKHFDTLVQMFKERGKK